MNHGHTYPYGDVQLFFVGEEDADGPLQLGQDRHGVQRWGEGAEPEERRSPPTKLLQDPLFSPGNRCLFGLFFYFPHVSIQAVAPLPWLI